MICSYMEFGSCDDGAPQSRVGAPAIRRILSKQTGLISSLMVEYTVPAATEKSVPRGRFVRRLIAQKAPSSFLLDQAHGQPALPWEDDPFRQVAYVTGAGLFNSFPFSRSFFFKPFPDTAALPDHLGDDLYLVATGFWVLSRRPAPRPFGIEHFWVDVVKSEAYSIVRPKQERVGGRWCHVLERPGSDILWLDLGDQCRLVAREINHPTTGALLVRFDLDDPISVLAGKVQLPRAVQATWFDALAPRAADRNRIVRRRQLRVDKINVNDVSSDIFEFHPAPGEIDLGTQRSDIPVQVSAGALDYLNAVGDWLEKYQSPKDRHPRESSLSWIELSICIGCVASGIAASRLFTMRRPSTAR